METPETRQEEQQEVSEDSTVLCPLLNLPVELFELIIKQLSSISAYNLVICNHSLYDSTISGDGSWMSFSVLSAVMTGIRGHRLDVITWCGAVGILSRSFSVEDQIWLHSFERFPCLSSRQLTT
jgi:hypothetical protein